MHDHTHVVGYDANDLPDRWPPRRPAQIEDAMLLGHPADEHLGVLEQLPEPFAVLAANRLTSERLRSRIDHRLAGDGGGHHGGEDGERAIVPVARARREGAAVVEHVGSRTDLRDAGQLVGAPERRRRAAADHAWGECRVVKALDRARQRDVECAERRILLAQWLAYVT